MYKTAFLCTNCWNACDDDVNSMYVCKHCNSSRTMINLENSFDLWDGLTDEEKQEEINVIKKFGKPYCSGEKITNMRERAKNGFIHSMPVTTCDVHSNYKILGPVYYQINDGGIGASLNNKAKEYERLMNDMGREGLLSDKAYSVSETIDAFERLVGIFGGGLSAPAKDSLGQNSNMFDIAFFIAIEELKKRAYTMGANAIIGMKQDLDLDTNGFQHFYLQAYGTAVKTETSDEELTIEDVNHEMRICSANSKKIYGGGIRDVDVVEIDTSEKTIKCPVCGLEQRSDRYKCWNCGVEFKHIYKD